MAEKARVELQVVLDRGAASAVASEIDRLEKGISSRESSHGKDDPVVKRLKTQQNLVHQIKNEHEKANEALTKYKLNLGGMLSNTASFAGNLAQRAGGALGGAAGAGLGGVGSAVGAVAEGGPWAWVAAFVAGGVMLAAQATRMALDFERAGNRVGLLLDNGSTNFRAGMDSLNKVALSKEAQNLGWGGNEMMAGMGAYAAGSGETLTGVAAAGPDLAKYATITGMDPASIGGMLGNVVGNSPSDTAKSAGDALIGSAEGSGRMGRRLGEFVGVATSVLASLQLNDPGKNHNIGEAASITKGVANLGGVFSTPQGVQMAMSAFSSLMGGTSTSMSKMGMAARAGVSQEDIALEKSSPENERKMMLYAMKVGGKSRLSQIYEMNVMTGNAAASRTIFAAYDATGKDGKNQTTAARIARMVDNKDALSLDPTKRLNDYLDTTVSHFNRINAHLEDSMLNMGIKLAGSLTSITDMFGNALSLLDKVVNEVAADFGKLHGILTMLGLGGQTPAPQMGPDGKIIPHGAQSADYTPYGGATYTGNWIKDAWNTFTGAGSGYDPHMRSEAGFDGSGGIRSERPGVSTQQFVDDLHLRHTQESHGSTDALLAGINHMTAKGWHLGIYAAAIAHASGSANDPHHKGLAVDVSSVEGESITGAATAKSVKAAEDWLKDNRTNLLGAPYKGTDYAGRPVDRSLYNRLHAEFGDRVFKDTAGHEHWQVTNEYVAAPQYIPPKPKAGVGVGVGVGGGFGAPSVKPHTPPPVGQSRAAHHGVADHHKVTTPVHHAAATAPKDSGIVAPDGSIIHPPGWSSNNSTTTTKTVKTPHAIVKVSVNVTPLNESAGRRGKTGVA